MHGVTASPRLVVLYAFVVHLIFVYATFDVHFQSPLVAGVERADARLRAPARRLVIFVADGARADAVFDEARGAAHVRSRARGGAWGVSHARAPTESRPGHVALLGGFYEDPSAITKGWSANPVEFDHLVNQSNNAWAWGAPSVVPLFADGVDGARRFCYDETLEDFASANDHGALDEWVFDRVVRFLESNGVEGSSESDALDGDGNVFLLHLLGLDSSGHAHKPHSSEYFENIRIVDEGVRRVEAAFVERFGDDGKTAFVFTADHGMSNKGAHGDGDPGCTETPLVVWGAGVASGSQKVAGACRGTPETPKDWGMDPETRCDVDQADVAPLGATLIGFPPPRHNSGLLPSAYLSDKPEDLKSSAMIANAKQLLALHDLKAARTAKRALSALFSFKLHPDMISVSSQVAEYERLDRLGRHDDATRGANQVARACLRGLEYLHTYDRALLQAVVVSCFATWMILLAVNLLPRRKGECETPTGIPLTLALIYAGVVSVILLARRAPPTYFLYFGLPAYFLLGIVNTLSAVKIESIADISLLNVGICLVGAFAVAETICNGFHDRVVFSYAFAFGSALLVALAIRLLFRRDFDNATRAAVMAISTAMLAPFTMLSIELEANTEMIVSGLLASALLGTTTHVLIRPLDIFQDDAVDRETKRRPGQTVFALQILMVLTTGVLVTAVDGLQRGKLPVPTSMHAASWIVALMAPILPMFSPPRTLPRMISVFLGFASTYGLFSVSYESLFYACLGFCLLSWMILERGLQAPSPAKSKMFTRTIIPSDLRHAAMFLFLIDAAFFGTGNIASIASFDLSSVYRFTTRFNPFLMGALLVLKVLLPMITVAAAFLVVLKSSRVPAFESYFMFLILSDIMAVRFFFQITTVGSWLDIGSSVSRYALMGTQVVTILPFLALAQIFTRALPVNGRTAIIRTKRD